MKRTLQSYFHQSLSKDPARPAIHTGTRYHSYAELDRAAQKVAGFLRASLPAGSQHCIGILCEKGLTAYAGLLGAMDSGNIYVPLNPKLPLNRLECIANLAQLQALVVDADSASRSFELLALLGREIPVLLPDDTNLSPELRKFSVVAQMPDWESHCQAGSVVRPGNDGPDYAYLLFTSGTTGNPKGVPVTHENAAACIDAVCKRFEFFPEDRFTQFSELSFDVSIADIFLCWKAGACLYVPFFSDVMMPVEFTARHKLTVWSSVPTIANNVRALGVLKPRSLDSLRLSYFCGEALPTPLMKEWMNAAPRGVIVNFYGPTEAAIFSTCYVYDKENPPAEQVMPLGEPLSGFDCRIVKDAASTDEETGELLLAGPQVVTGYWHDEAATKKAFVKLPDDPAGRVWYRTGDRVGRNSDNHLTFHGRCDRQIKLRGYRIELDEVEAVIRKVTDADLVAVIPVYARDGRCKDIFAFCDSAFDDESEIKRQCGNYLPAYMLPKRIIHLAQFPRSSNGKLDYRALTAYLKGHPGSARHVQAA